MVLNTSNNIMMSRRVLAATLFLATVSGSAAFSPSRRRSALLQSTEIRQPASLWKTSAGRLPLNELGTNTRNGGSLQMVAAPSAGVAVAAVAGAVSGGLFAGGLHAVAGPDHLAALLPRCCGQRWYRAGRIGALWGMGHGVSACLLGILAFGLKSRVSQTAIAKTVLTGASHVMEIAVGLSLVVIGLLGIKEAQEWKAEMIEGAQPQSLSAAAADPGIKTAQKRAVIFNGLLHGFSWDGAPSLAPALAVATWRGNLTFLFSYAIGTMASMAVTTTLIGEGTRRAGEWFHRPDIPQKLSFGSSILAIVIGAIWCGLALV